MTRDDIIKMAREVGLCDANGEDDDSVNIVDALHKFAVRVLANTPPNTMMTYREGYAAGVAAEREACAKVCEQSDEDGEGPDCWGWHAKDFARAIRARGNT